MRNLHLVVDEKMGALRVLCLDCYTLIDTSPEKAVGMWMTNDEDGFHACS